MVGKERVVTAAPGHIVTLDLQLTPENGYIPEPLFDCGGRVTFVLHGGNYLPGLHELVQRRCVGDSVNAVSIDAGWGERRDDLLITVSLQKLKSVVNDPSQLAVGQTLKLKGGIDVLVAEVNEDTVTLDANPPLAGTSYACTFTVVAIDPMPTYILPSKHKDRSSSVNNCCCTGIDGGRYQLATFALGCFWGAELAFMRVPGVVGTKVGYSQGVTPNPTYEQVCTGRTQHREAVQVVFNSELVSYEDLVEVAMGRLQSVQSPLDLHRLFQESGNETKQYSHGFYYHSTAQRELAEAYIADNNNRFGIEVLEAAMFWEADVWHQQYLFKGGQSARKGAKETIRCYG